MNGEASFSGNQRSRLRGVQHLPQADIQNIKDLLRGYGSPGSLMKELIQNAEDAEARYLDLILTPGDAQAIHPLLRNPALCAVNNGTFQPKHLDAIFRLGLGTKGADPRAIGRFGKGLKSVFAFCEAFFVAARTDQRDGWNPNESVCQFFNPWNGWRHQDWDDAFDSATEKVFAQVAAEVADFGENCPHWLAFWLPLRHHAHQEDPKGPVAWIHESSANVLPGEDGQLGTTFACEFQALAPSLVTLRNLRRIRLIDASREDRRTTQWSLSAASRRSSEPGRSREPETLSGCMILTDSGAPDVRLTYTGYAGTLPESKVVVARARPGWPTVVDISEAGSSADQKAKGEPHYATILTAQPAATGNLELRWSVFFPVSEQPEGTCSVALPRLKQTLTLTLHGFFFLDTERRRVDGLQQHFSDRRHACLEWNQIIATEGTLAHVPQAFASFAGAQNLRFDECIELAQAFRQTWVWSRFAEATCRQQSWRPRWRAGAEKWELIPATATVYSIPRISAASDVLACFPRLAGLSELVTIVARGSDESLPGLYHSEAEDWPEDLVLKLLEDVELNHSDRAPAEWLNGFLTSLRDKDSLTHALRERVSTLPLLPVRVTSTGEHRRISGTEWNAAIAAGQLFAPAAQTDGWLRLLHPALPGWSCLTAEWTMPGWFMGQYPPLLNAPAAAAAVLAHPTLGGFRELTELVRHFISQPGMCDLVRLAGRYLMHGDAAQARSGQPLLFMPSTQPSQLIWSRLIKQVLIHEGGENSWRLLHQQWASVLSLQAQQDLTVSTIDAQGAWEELMTAQADFGTLEFPAEHWSDADVSALLHGLYQAGHSDPHGTLALLRRLRLHNLRGQHKERVSVAAADGELGDLFVLHTLNFEAAIPKEIVPLWERFLSTTKVVDRVEGGLAATVQQELFRRSTAEGEVYDATLDWNFVVRRCLEAEEPFAWAPMIMVALSHGDHAVRGLGAKLKRTEWLPLTTGASLAPDSIILIEGLEKDLYELLDPSVDGLGGVRALQEWVTKHEGFSTLKKYFPSLAEALESLALWVADKPRWHLGVLESSLPQDHGSLLPILETLSELPGASLLAKLWRLPNQAKNTAWDSTLRDTVWKGVLKRFDYEGGGIQRLERVLSSLASTPSRPAFEAYLRQAVADSVIWPMLSRLSLMNQVGEWRPARELIWPSVNLNSTAQLCHGQAEILSPIRSVEAEKGAMAGDFPGLPAHLAHQGNRLDHAPDFDAQADVVGNYLQPFRDGNVGEILPAALVAVLGGYPRMRQLLRDLLEAGLGQHPDDFLALLLGESRERVIEAVHSERFLIEVVRGDIFRATTITGATVEVSLTEDIETLIVGDPSELWGRYFYQNQHDTACHYLRLRWVERPDDLTDPVAVFASTVETILLRAHCNGVAKICPQNLKEVLGNVADAGQADLRRSQLYLLDMAEGRLKELALRGMSSLDRVLRKFSEARQARVDAQLLKSQAPMRARQRTDLADRLICDARSELVELLTSPSGASARTCLIEAVRRKMTDFQYSLSSVALELFQNADDAVAEWEQMKSGLLPNEDQFLIQIDEEQRILEVIHWGRPINRHAFPGFLQGSQRGYEQDLQKMLTLNFSDKGVGDDGEPTIVTGRFGLGFKTAFFVADEPEVISGRLAFEIRGGFYPVALPPEKAVDLRHSAEAASGRGLVPTAFRLRWSGETSASDPRESFEKLAKIAPLLTIFSRRIRGITMNNCGATATIQSKEEPLTANGRLLKILAGNAAFLCMRCTLTTDRRPASVLFAIDSSGISALADDLPRLWITVPTAEHSDFRWAINAPFKPDAGRQRLALNNPVNQEIADAVAHTWREALLELFDETDARWTSISERLGLRGTSSFEHWWMQFWREMARVRPVLRWDLLRDGGQVLGYIAWGLNIGAARWLVQERAAIPTGLLGSYRRMAKGSDVRFEITGLLSALANGCFATIAEWASVQMTFPPGQTVCAEVASFVREVGVCPNLRGKVTLQAVISAEIGERLEVNYLGAERLGRLFKESSAPFEPGSVDSFEIQPLLSWLSGAKMLASDGQYHVVGTMVSSRPLQGSIDTDEVLRAGFAPARALLCSGYSDVALHFFERARGELSATATTLAEWIKCSAPGQHAGVFKYLITGELAQHVADALGRPWLESVRTTQAYAALSPLDQNEVERKFLRGRIWMLDPPPLSQFGESPVFQVMDADVAFRCVSDWWTRECTKWIEAYEKRTYPNGYPGTLPWPGEDDWDANTAPCAASRWLLLFIHAALVPLGFNRIGRDQSFTQFLVEKGWMDIFARVAAEPEALIAALDEYLGTCIQNTAFHFQMRQFIAFYAVSRNLDSFLYSLRTAECTVEVGAFNLVFSPNANPALSGTGIVAPPLSGLLGMGTCQLLRELYRRGRLGNPSGYQFAFTPIRKVRRLCAQLFGTSEGSAGANASVQIFRKLRDTGTRLGLDPTFNHCFDLPFQFLAEDKALRTRVLREDFEAEEMDSPELDSAPRDFPLQPL
ncbi:MAG: hypothetical protein IT581_15595 [Verrucomicrobiales bacterium]|nr:hypothetical protein [Verrucomicrobiales bacterium]